MFRNAAVYWNHIFSTCSSLIKITCTKIWKWNPLMIMMIVIIIILLFCNTTLHVCVFIVILYIYLLYSCKNNVQKCCSLLNHILVPALLSIKMTSIKLWKFNSLISLWKVRVEEVWPCRGLFYSSAKVKVFTTTHSLRRAFIIVLAAGGL